jgi:V/A-type H+-transporting ATPase subunit K
MEAVGMGYVLALIGMGCMVGLSGAGSGWGFGMVGAATLGVLKKKPEAFGSCLVLSALPSTNGLYGFVGFIMYSGMLQQFGNNVSLAQGGIVLGAGIAMGIACLITCIGQAKIAASGIVGVGGGHNVFGNTLILAAFPEFYAILSLVAAILLMPLVQILGAS